MTDSDPTTEPLPEGARDSAIARAARRVAGGVVHWMPVWIPLGVLAQLGLLGLKPALLEEQRLRRAEERLALRLEGLREERRELQWELRAFEDPVYIERLSRLRRD